MKDTLTIRVELPMSVVCGDGVRDHDVVIKESDIEEALYEVCSSVHSSCDSTCPVYSANGGSAPLVTIGKGESAIRECSCFKSGGKMLAFLKISMKRGCGEV